VDPPDLRPDPRGGQRLSEILCRPAAGVHPQRDRAALCERGRRLLRLLDEQALELADRPDAEPRAERDRLIRGTALLDDRGGRQAPEDGVDEPALSRFHQRYGLGHGCVGRHAQVQRL
jgi:hypothetical protein